MGDRFDVHRRFAARRAERWDAALRLQAIDAYEQGDRHDDDLDAGTWNDSQRRARMEQAINHEMEQLLWEHRDGDPEDVCWLWIKRARALAAVLAALDEAERIAGARSAATDTCDSTSPRRHNERAPPVLVDQLVDDLVDAAHAPPRTRPRATLSAA